MTTMKKMNAKIRMLCRKSRGRGGHHRGNSGRYYGQVSTLRVTGKEGLAMPVLFKFQRAKDSSRLLVKM